MVFPILSTRDMDESLDFYRDLLGAAVTYRFPAAGEPVYVSLDLGPSHLGLSLDQPGAQPAGQPGPTTVTMADSHRSFSSSASSDGRPTMLVRASGRLFGTITPWAASAASMGTLAWTLGGGAVDGKQTERLVRSFYADAWNRWDEAAVDELLGEEFVFRGSLGDEVRGRDGFRGYRDKIRAAFPDFHNEIVDLIVEGERAAARLRYSGHHSGEVLSVAATGAPVTYSGAAFFTARDGRLREVWVLGDVDGLRRQLARAAEG